MSRILNWGNGRKGGKTILYQRKFILLLLFCAVGVFYWRISKLQAAKTPPNNGSLVSYEKNLDICLDLNLDLSRVTKIAGYDFNYLGIAAIGNLCKNKEGAVGEMDDELEAKITSLVADYPIYQMLPFMSGYDEKVIGLLIGIAKKESNWGRRVPRKSGKDCYNYWGFKGRGGSGSAGEFSCFADPREAVVKVAGRINQLAHEQGRDTPAEMIVWKCGYSCRGHNSRDVKKWISDVEMYYRKIVS